MKSDVTAAFLGVFRARADVYAEPWEARKPGADGKKRKGWSPACRRKFDERLCPLSSKNQLTGGCADCGNRDFAPLTDELVWEHLHGKRHIGLYPLLPRAETPTGAIENACFFAAVDFDDHAGDKDPLRDATTFREACEVQEIPVHLERSRSGAGYHAWMFFPEAVPAALARRAVFGLLGEAQLVGEADSLDSFDRIFPNQDRLTGKGLGNLIAAPLCGQHAGAGNTLFLDPDNGFAPYPKQMVFVRAVLEQIRAGHGDLVVTRADLERIVAALGPAEPPGPPAGMDLPAENYGLGEDGAPDRSAGPVLEKCSFIRWCGEKPAEVTEPLWRNMISNLGRFPDGPDAIHELSARDARRYSRADTDAKIAHLKGSSAPITCAMIRADGFTGCPPGGCGVKSPAGLAYKTDPADVGAIIDSIPEGLEPGPFASRLDVVYRALAKLAIPLRTPFYEKLKERFRIPVADSKKTTIQYWKEERKAKAGASREPFVGEVEVDPGRNVYFLEEKDRDGEAGETRVIASFILRPVERVWVDGQELVVADILAADGKVFPAHRFPRSAWNSKRSFIAALPAVDLQWTGSDNNVQGVLRRVSEVAVPSRRGTRVLGHMRDQGRDLWVAPGHVFSKDGPLESGEIVFVDDGNPMPRRIVYGVAEPAAYQDLARQVYRLLPRVNDLAVTLPMIGWFFATPLKPILRLTKLMTHFPILFVWGTAGTGKTSLLSEIFWPLFGVPDGEAFSATQTEFALLRLLASTNGVPVFVDEFKPADMPKHRLEALLRMMRRIYSGEEETRGNMDKTITGYHLQAPLAIAGESRPQIQAILERILSVCPNKNTLAKRPDCVEAFHELRRADLAAFAVPYIAFVLASDVAEILAAGRARAEAILARVKNSRAIFPRLVDNLSAMMAGLLLYERYAERQGIPAANLGYAEPDVARAVAVMLDEVVEGEFGAKSGLDSFLEVLSVLAINGEIRHGVHYSYRDSDSSELCIHFRSCHAAYLEHLRRTGSEAEGLDHLAIRHQMRESNQRGGYVRELAAVVRFGGANRKVAVIDLPAAMKHLDVEPFPTGENASGGYPNARRDYPRESADATDFLHGDDDDAPF